MSAIGAHKSWLAALVIMISLCNAFKEIKPRLNVREMEQLERSNFLVGVASYGVRLSNSTQCGKELETFLKAISEHELWSLKLIDSFGGIPKTFSWGNYHWFSAQELCDDLNSPFRISFSSIQRPVQVFNVSSPFPMSFWMIYFRFTTPYYIDLKLPFERFIHVGLCLPKSCLPNDIFEYSDGYFGNNIFETQRNFKIKMNAVRIKEPEFNWSFFKQSGSIIYISIVILVLSLGISAELLYKSKLKLKSQLTIHWKNTGSGPTRETISALTTSSLKTTVTEEFLLCFRLSENYKRCLQLEDKNNFLTVIAGLRTIICLWITVFHVYYYSLFAMTNTPLVFAKLENLIFQPIMQSCFYVDVFFLMRLQMLCCWFIISSRTKLKSEALNRIRALLISDYFRRRLTPVLIVTMLLSDRVFDFLNMYSPFLLDMHSGIYCKNSWWFNLLYVQNFLDMKNICCSWTWYLACEMQFFILFNTLLFIYAKNERIAKILYLLITVVCMFTSFLCNYYNNITFQIDIIYTTLDQLYVKPWIRITPYIVGASFGWLLHRRKNQRRLQLAGESSSTLLTTMFWLCFGGVYLVTNFMTYWRSAPSFVVAGIMSFGKLLFALCVGGAIVMCAWRRGGVFNNMLSSRPFLFLNKFCFSIYLIAPVNIISVFGLRLQATTFDEVSSGVDFLAVIVLTMASAFLLVVLLELPMQRIASKFIKQR